MIVFQWAGSCWYYLRFLDPKNKESIFSEDAASWLPVDLYVGGQEHAVLHLLYARFWHQVLHDIGVVDHPEPFLKLVHQGMILGSDGEKMSKSRGNVINPDDIVTEYGADALRLYEMFMGPLEAVKPWQTNQLLGVVRLRDRVYNMLNTLEYGSEISVDLNKEMHKTIKKVTEDIDRLSFNTAISALMIYSNTLASLNGPIPKKAYETLILLLSPFAPHMAEECWNLMGHSKTLAYEKWPSYLEELCCDSTSTIIIQINGKVRGKLEAAVDSTEEFVVEQAMTQPNIVKYSGGKPIKKTIFVPGKILNILI